MSKMTVVEIRGKDLRDVMRIFEYLILSDVYNLRVGVDSDGFKVSADFGTWTPGYGTLKD